MYDPTWIKTIHQAVLPSSTGSISSIDDIDPDRIDKLLVVWSVTYVIIGHIVHDEI